MPTGAAVIDFGVHPGRSMASVAVTGQTGITGSSKVEAQVQLASTADHSVDEHRVETLKFTAGSVVAGTGFTIYAEVLQGQTWGTFNVDWVYA